MPKLISRKPSVQREIERRPVGLVDHGRSMLFVGLPGDSCQPGATCEAVDGIARGLWVTWGSGSGASPTGGLAGGRRRSRTRWRLLKGESHECVHVAVAHDEDCHRSAYRAGPCDCLNRRHHASVRVRLRCSQVLPTSCCASRPAANRLTSSEHLGLATDRQLARQTIAERYLTMRSLGRFRGRSGGVCWYRTLHLISEVCGVGGGWRYGMPVVRCRRAEAAHSARLLGVSVHYQRRWCQARACPGSSLDDGADASAGLQNLRHSLRRGLRVGWTDALGRP